VGVLAVPLPSGTSLHAGAIHLDIEDGDALHVFLRASAANDPTSFSRLALSAMFALKYEVVGRPAAPPHPPAASRMPVAAIVHLRGYLDEMAQNEEGRVSQVCELLLRKGIDAYKKEGAKYLRKISTREKREDPPK
jgi:hypothetical protein